MTHSERLTRAIAVANFSESRLIILRSIIETGQADLREMALQSGANKANLCRARMSLLRARVIVARNANCIARNDDSFAIADPSEWLHDSGATPLFDKELIRVIDADSGPEIVARNAICIARNAHQSGVPEGLARNDCAQSSAVLHASGGPHIESRARELNSIQASCITPASCEVNASAAALGINPREGAREGKPGSLEGQTTTETSAPGFAEALAEVRRLWGDGYARKLETARTIIGRNIGDRWGWFLDAIPEVEAARARPNAKPIRNALAFAETIVMDWITGGRCESLMPKAPGPDPSYPIVTHTAEEHAKYQGKIKQESLNQRLKRSDFLLSRCHFSDEELDRVKQETLREIDELEARREAKRNKA